MIRAVLARFYARQMAARGVPLDALLAGTGIDPARFEEPGYVIDLLQLRRLAGNLHALRPEPGFGLRMGAAVSIRDLGVLGYALMSCDTLSQALPMYDSFYDLGGSPIFFRSSTVTDGIWQLTLDETVPLDQALPLCIEVHLSMLKKLSELLLVEPLEFREIKLSYPPPAHAREYEATFRCPVRFNAALNAACFDAGQLDARIASADSETHAMFLAYCSELIAKLSPPDGITDRVRDVLLASKERVPTIGEVAESLGYTERTLRRTLQAAGANYNDIVQQYRKDLALEFLNTTTLAPKEIAHMLGFSDITSFRRAFKAWTGQPVGEYRKQLTRA